MTVGTYGGSPDLEISYGKLLPGQSITITVVFGGVSLGEKVTYTPEVFIGVLPASLTKSSRPAVLWTTPAMRKLIDGDGWEAGGDSTPPASRRS